MDKLSNQPPELLFEENCGGDCCKKKTLKLRYGRLILLLLIVSGAVFFTKEYTGASIYGSEFAAVVNDHKITLSELDEKYNTLPEYYKSMVTKTDLLNQMIDDYLVTEDVKSKGVIVSDEELKDTFSELKAEMDMDDAAFMSALNKQGMELDKVLVALKNKLMVDKFVDEQLFKGMTVSDAELFKYYESMKDQFTEPEKVKARHILIKTEKLSDTEALAKIDGLLERYNAGEKFEDLAKGYSECPSGVNGGDLGYFTKDQMVKPFADAAFALEVGKISEPVKSEFGYHLILVDEKVPSKTLSFEEAKSQIDSLALQEKQQKIFDTYIEQLKAKADVKILLKE
jgi:peptidyl-prolyl cis-trans isomerase C